MARFPVQCSAWRVMVGHTQTQYMIIPQTKLFKYTDSKQNSVATAELFAAEGFRNLSTVSGRFSLLLPPLPAWLPSQPEFRNTNIKQQTSPTHREHTTVRYKDQSINTMSTICASWIITGNPWAHCRQNAEMFNVTASGTYSYHCAQNN